MTKKIIKSTSFCLSLMLLASCGGGEQSSSQTIDSYERYEYSATHESSNKVMSFYSSNSELDFFLNDFLERHMRYTENAIHTHPVGLGKTAWKEWEAKIGSWWDSSNDFNNTLPKSFATKDHLYDFLLNATQDKQGYVFADSGKTSSDWGMGWQFPNYTQGGKGFTFDRDKENFTSINSYDSLIMDTICPNDNSSELVIYGSGSESQIGFESPNFRVGVLNAPFIKMRTKFVNNSNTPIEDMYIYFQTEDEAFYSEDKKVSYSQFAINGEPFVDGLDESFIVFPMYLNSKWGRSESNVVTKLKIVIESENNQGLNGSFYVDDLLLEYDDRQPNNMANYIITAEEMVSNTQNKQLLEAVLPNALSAYLGYQNMMYDNQTKLMSSEYFVGHETFGFQVTGYGIGNGYWDVASHPNINIYVNVTYYRALQSLIKLMETAESFSLVPSAKVLNRDLTGEVIFDKSLAELKAELSQFKKAFSDYFWNEEKGRFIGGYYEGNTKNEQDYGYLNYNLEAVASGLATDSQSQKIMSWISGERTVEGDTAIAEDIYKHEFAPLNTTKQNQSDYIWLYGGSSFGSGVHNGGAVMQTSYYDLLARANTFGGDNAYDRLIGINDWYYKVIDAGGQGQNFYRTYFNEIGVSMQGGNTVGSVGLDYEFLEAGILIASVPDAFFGLDILAQDIHISPNMPSELDFWKMENLTFKDIYYDLTISKYFVEISFCQDKAGNTANVEGSQVVVCMDKPSFDFVVQYNGENIEYQVVDGKINVSVPMTNGKVEIIKK